MISAIDGDLKTNGGPDIFRIKIWHKESDMVFYDNEMGIEIDQDPTTQIEEGSIVVHVPKNKNKSASLNSDELGLETDYEVEAYPNPTDGRVYLNINVDDYSDIKVIVTNSIGQKVFESDYSNSRRIELNLAGNSAGIYQVSTVVKDKIFTNRIILKKN